MVWIKHQVFFYCMFVIMHFYMTQMIMNLLHTGVYTTTKCFLVMYPCDGEIRSIMKLDIRKQYPP